MATKSHLVPKTARKAEHAHVKDYLHDAKENFTLVDLFAGIGGFHYGVGAAARMFDKGVKPLLVSEWEESCKAVYVNNHGAEDVYELGDIMDISDKKIRMRAHSKADILTAGFPCQPFSNSGKKLGLSDPRGQFYGRIEELIKKFDAKSFILENVPGIRTNGGQSAPSKLSYLPDQPVGRTMQILEDAMLRGLASRYHINWIEIDSSKLGSPQVRKRVYIVGIRKDVGSMPDLSRVSDSGVRNPFRAIVDPKMKPGTEAWDVLRLNPNQERNIRNDMKRRSPSFTDGMRRVGNAYTCPGGNVGQAYHADGLVPTLTKVWARFLPVYFPSGEETRPAIDDRDFKPDEYYGLHGELRRASLREVMLLQGFPKEFKYFKGDGRRGSSVGYEHAGNAVNAVVVRAIAHELLARVDAC